MTPESVLLALIAALLLAVLVVYWRVSNSSGSITWQLRTREPESSVIRVERDAARREAERLRVELEALAANMVPSLEHSRGHE